MYPRWIHIRQVVQHESAVVRDDALKPPRPQARLHVLRARSRRYGCHAVQAIAHVLERTTPDHRMQGLMRDLCISRLLYGEKTVVIGRDLENSPVFRSRHFGVAESRVTVADL